MKKILCMIMAVAMVFSFSFTAFADGTADTAPIFAEGVSELELPLPSTRSLSGYASKFVSSSGDGSFTVTVTGSAGLKAGLTFKTSCDESNSGMAVITIQRPNGGYIFSDLAFSSNEEEYFSFYFPTTGTYTISYVVYVPSGATIQMQCWIY